MGQKVNPVSLRLQQTNREFDNCWYTDYFYRKLVSRDIYLQQYINSFLKLVKYPSARFSIQYSTKKIKLSSFLCYPKQSREIRSRMFGITFIKKRKNKLKKNYHQLFLSNKKEKRGLTSYQLKRNAYSSFLHSKKELRGKNILKTMKFLIDHNLWSRVYNPLNPFLKKNRKVVPLINTHSFLQNKKEIKESHVLIDDKKTQLNKNNLSFSKMYHDIFLRVYKNKDIFCFENSRKISGNYLLPYLSKEFSQKNRQQLLSLPFGRFLVSKKQLNPQIFSSRKNQKGNYLLYFIKNFVTTLFFVRVLNTPVSFLRSNFTDVNLFGKKELKEPTKKLSQQFLFLSSFIHTKKEIEKNKNHSKNTNFSNFTLQYKKNYIKFFLVFYLLYTEYNRNIYSNSVEYNSVLHSNKESMSKFTFVNLQGNLDSKKHCFLSSKKNLVNLVSCFSIFQPLSIFHTILQKKTSVNLLLQQNSKLLSNLKKDSNLLKISPFLNTITTKNAKKLQQFKYKNYIEHFLCSQFKLNAEFLPFGVSQDWQSAGFLADEIVYFLERRVTFRRLKHKIIKKIAENSTIRGVRISCSGRVGGKSKKAQRAKTECVKYGQTSRHTFSSRIDFAVRTARTSFGSVGIKIWICYN